jgi:hypothetical protein
MRVSRYFAAFFNFQAVCHNIYLNKVLCTPFLSYYYYYYCVNTMCTVLLPPGVNPMCTVLLPPGVNTIAVNKIYHSLN